MTSRGCRGNAQTGGKPESLRDSASVVCSIAFLAVQRLNCVEQQCVLLITDMSLSHLETLSQHLQECARKNDATTIASLLRHRNVASLSLDNPLICSSEDAISLTENAFSPGDHDNDNLEMLFRALLISPSSYDTPWKSVYQLIVGLRDSLQPKKSFLWSITADIQSFIKNAVSIWWDEERRQTASKGKRRRSVGPADVESNSDQAPRRWIEKWVKAIMDPINNNSHLCANPPDFWSSLVDILPTLVSIARDLDQTLLHSILDMIFQEPVRSSQLLMWTNLAAELCLFLRSTDWERVRTTLKEALGNGHMDAQELPGVAESVFRVCTSLLASQDHIPSDISGWQDLLMDLMQAAESDLSIYSTVETMIETGLASLPSKTLQSWSKYLVQYDGTAPSYIQASMVLLIQRATTQSGSQLVASLLAKSLGTNSSTWDLHAVVWDKIVSLALSESSSKKLFQKLIVELDGIVYLGKGRFDGSNERTVVLLSDAGEIAHQNLWLKLSNRPDNSKCIYLLERAQAWVQGALKFISTANCQDNFSGSVTAAAILVVVYYEVPLSRNYIIRAMVQSFSDQLSRTKVTTFYCSILPILVSSSATDRSPSDSGFDQLASICSMHLPSALFNSLSKALSEVPACQGALLSFAQKNLRSGPLDLWAFESTAIGYDETQSQLKSALSTLSQLFASRGWNETQMQAWDMIADVLINARPRLPTGMRRWFARELINIVQTRKLSDFKMHLVLVSCLARVLTFVEFDEQGRGGLNLGLGSSGVSNHCGNDVAQELCGLLHLIFEILFSFLKEKNSTSTGIQHDPFNFWFNRLWNLLSQDEAAATEILETSPGPTSGETFPYQACNCAFTILLVMLGDVLGRRNVTNVGMSSTSMNSFLGEQLRVLLQDNSNHLALPDWLKCEENSISGCRLAGRSAEYVSPAKAVYGIVVDIATDIMIGSRWKKESEGAQIYDSTWVKTKAECMAELIGIRRKLMHSEDKSFSPYRNIASDLHHLDAYCTILLSNRDGNQRTERFRSQERDALLTCLSNVLERASTIIDDNESIGYDLLPKLWTIYSELLSHAACSALFLYLQLDKQPQAQQHLQQFSSIDEIENFIRRHKVSFLTVLCRVLHAINAQKLDHKLAQNQSNCANYLIDFICSFGTDIAKGVELDSVGLSFEMFHCYLDCLEQLSWTLSKLHDDDRCSDFGHRIISACGVCGKAIESILFMHYIKNISLLKKAVLVMTDALPFCAGSIERQLLINGNMKCEDIEQYAVLISSLTMCTDIVKNKVSVPWISPHDDDASDCSAKQSDQQKIKPRFSNSEAVSSGGIQLWNERSWGATLATLLQATDMIWEDSFQLLSDRISFTSTEGVKLYCIRRQNRMLSLLTAMSCCFDRVLTSSGCDDDCMVYASHLPTKAKQFLVGAVGKFVSTLNKSLKQLDSLDDKAFVPSVHCLGHEALTVVAAWLRVPSQQRDILASCYAWYRSEQQYQNAASSVTQAESNILQRISKTVLRVEEIESMLMMRYPTQVTKQKQVTGRNKPSNQVSVLRGLMEQLGVSSFNDALNAKLSNLQNERSKLGSKNAKRAASDELQRLLKKERRRRVLHSRNKVVDTWLQLDREIGADEAFDDDAYADLEDFLVEG